MRVSARTGDAEHDGGLPSMIRQWAELDPLRTAITFVDYSVEPQGHTRHWTYAELDLRMRAVAQQLRRITSPGARAAILCPTGIDYVTGFLACLHSGVIAVPLFAPDAYRRNDRIALAMKDAGCDVVITTLTARDAISDIPLPGPVQIICPEEVELDAAPDTPSAAVALGSTAYLQYTSGSTRQPAGVRVTRRNMTTAVRQLSSRLQVDRRSTIVSWLPLFHDMGLIFAAILPLTCGFPVVHLTPLAFVKQPFRWLKLLSDYAGTHVLAPNFSFDLCTDWIPPEQRAELDLSSISYLGNGAEPVRADTLSRFTEAFAPCGFRPATHAPAYGLAEATLMVAGVRPGQGPMICSFDRAELTAGRVRRIGAGDPRAMSMVGCGPALEQTVRIVDPATGSASATDEVGEIWVHGDNVCAGYWTQDERTNDVFGAVLDGEDGWLRTGDLGFLHDGSLFIAGRLRDLIIVDGRNHHPVDIELTVEKAVAAVRRSHVAAFSFDAGDSERVVIAAELQDLRINLREQRTLIRRAVAAHHDVNVYDVVFIRRGTMPKTSSGKLQRRSCRDRYLSGELTVVDDGSRSAANAS